MTGYINELRKLVGPRPIIKTGAGTLLCNEQDNILSIHRTDNNTGEFLVVPWN